MTEATLFERVIVLPTSCSCGGTHAWLGIRASGAYEMIGCVCHNPVPRAAIGVAIGDCREA